jgi:hypothetical protein
MLLPDCQIQQRDGYASATLLAPGDDLLVDLDGVFVLTPMMPIVPELAREIERTRQIKYFGLSIKQICDKM